ncbi:MAG: hypothetical protein IKA01_01950 [Alistipes sp.]|nr:hypothetical protein [Alistipes sp.]
MKRVCKRTVIIDALTVCCQVENNILLDKIAALEFGEVMDFYEFQLVRVDGRYFKNIYSIHYYEQDENKTFGQLKFGLNNGSVEGNSFESGKPKAWLTLSNRGLYESDLYYMGYICERLHLNVHNFTSVDLALDTPFDISRSLYRLYRNKDVTTILNGKRITNRDEDRPEISRSLSGSLNKDKYQTIYVKQRNAIHDKSKGVSLKTYDKLAEIRNSSDKNYILDFYANPRTLYRTEVHLNNEQIRDYLVKRNIDLCPYSMDWSVLEEMFFYHLNSLIRFERGREKILWEDLLGKR